MALLSEMWEAKLEPNVISYSAGISACEKGNQWQRALALLSEMWEAKLEPDVISPTWRTEARARRAGDQVHKIAPLRPQNGVESPATAQEAPQRGCKTVQERSKTALAGPETGLEAPKAPKAGQEAPKTAQEDSEAGPRRQKAMLFLRFLNDFQVLAISGQDRPKTAPEASQIAPRPPKRLQPGL